MKLGCQKIIVLFCMLIEFGSFGSEVGSITSEKPIMGYEMEALEEHESDGSERARGVPMQRSSTTQSVLVFLVLAFGGSLAYMAPKNVWSATPKNE
jgi:hypothetical protein